MNIKKLYIVCAPGILEKARSELLPPPDLSTQCLENNKKGYINYSLYTLVVLKSKSHIYKLISNGHCVTWDA